MTAGLVIAVTGTPATPDMQTTCIRPWRAAVAWDARHAMARARWQPPAGPVAVHVDFYLARPQSTPKSRTRPYVSLKLRRLLDVTIDALNEARVIEHETAICQLTADKHYGDWTGARITIRTLEGTT